MVEQTPAERALARSYVSVDGQVRFEVKDLSVHHHANRSVTFTYRITVERQWHPEEDWEFTLPWYDKSFTDVLTSPQPDPERLKQLLHLVHALLEEWWYTKGHNRQLAKMGRQLR
ncbi:hypothetical protein IPZ61_03930 [Streptomyces sioyaensis]|uniref:hypothetical protein n=1 Tax=Streptomyces sioyaensis TaxID=67364 RepID=UPI001F25CE19|nr:hypothetical protein [Streptomyces sioyaensis]MCF3172477.1 hypothetical protein [Streptomyces sioyaensis]